MERWALLLAGTQAWLGAFRQDRAESGEREVRGEDLCDPQDMGRMGSEDSRRCCARDGVDIVELGLGQLKEDL